MAVASVRSQPPQGPLPLEATGLGGREEDAECSGLPASLPILLRPESDLASPDAGPT